MENKRNMVTVAGFGDAGCKIANRIGKHYLGEVVGKKRNAEMDFLLNQTHFYGFNTNASSFNGLALNPDRSIVIGRTVTGGFGAGNDVRRAQAAFREDQEQIYRVIDRCNVFIPVAGLGKSTGYSCIQPVCEYAKQKNKLVIPIIAMPAFGLEVTFSVFARAINVLKQFNAWGMRIIQIDNRMAFTDPNASIKSAYDPFDEPIAKGLAGFIRFLAEPHDTDINDFRHWICNGKGRIWIGYTVLDSRSLRFNESNREAYQAAFQECSANNFYETNSSLCSEVSPRELASHQSTATEPNRSARGAGAVMFFVRGGTNILSAPQYGELCENFHLQLPADNDQLQTFFVPCPHSNAEAGQVSITAMWSEYTGFSHGSLAELDWQDISFHTTATAKPEKEKVVTATSPEAPQPGPRKETNGHPPVPTGNGTAAAPAPIPTVQGFTSIVEICEAAAAGNDTAKEFLKEQPLEITSELRQLLDQIDKDAFTRIMVLLTKLEFSLAFKKTLMEVRRSQNLTLPRGFTIPNTGHQFEVKHESWASALPYLKGKPGWPATDQAFRDAVRASFDAQYLFGPEALA